MATITNRKALAAGRFLAAGGPVLRMNRKDAEMESAYAQQAELATERAALVEEFVKARGHWVAELRVLAKAKRFDDAHPSRDPLYDELHAEQLYGQQYGEVA